MIVGNDPGRQEITQMSPVGRVYAEPRPSIHAQLFLLTWDNSKARNPSRRDLDKQECEGVRFSNGFVALDNGRGYETLGELEIVLGLAGTYSIAWVEAP